MASPTGGGELWTAAWRWWERRPRLALGVEAPSPFGGIWSLEALVENQTYGAAGSEIKERRRGVMLNASDWTSGVTRIKAGAAVDRWDQDTTASLVAGVERTFAGGLGRAMVDGSILVRGLRASTFGVTSDWRSSHSRVGSVWSTRGGLTTTTSETPLALLPGAGTGQGREVLLRAHPLLHDGVVRGVFGRRLVHAGGRVVVLGSSRPANAAPGAGGVRRHRTRVRGADVRRSARPRGRRRRNSCGAARSRSAARRCCARPSRRARQSCRSGG